MAEKKSGGGSKLLRTQTVTVRFDPKLRYLAELAARKQRRTVSSFIEWAVEQSLNNIGINDSADYNDRMTIANASTQLWDVDEAERFARLAVLYPELLTHDEQVLWKLIGDTGLSNLGRSGYSHSGKWSWHDLETKVFPEIRKNWDLFNKIASGEEPKESLPSWLDAVAIEERKLLEDDIPY